MKHIFYNSKEEITFLYEERFVSIPNTSDYDVVVNGTKYRQIGHIEDIYSGGKVNVEFDVWVPVSSLDIND